MVMSGMGFMALGRAGLLTLPRSVIDELAWTYQAGDRELFWDKLTEARKAAAERLEKAGAFRADAA